MPLFVLYVRSEFVWTCRVIGRNIGA
jgi:hypothetical protein